MLEVERGELSVRVGPGVIPSALHALAHILGVLPQVFFARWILRAASMEPNQSFQVDGNFS